MITTIHSDRRGEVPHVGSRDALDALSPPRVESGALWLSDLVAPPLAPSVTALEPSATGLLFTNGSVRAEDKATRRAQVRHERQSSDLPNGGLQDSTPPEILVLEGDAVTRDQICRLLRDFGFAVCAASEPGQAWVRATAHPLVAAFVNIPLDASDGGAGIDLCRFLRASGRRRGAAAPVLVLVAARLQPVDRVRAELGGFDETMLTPVTRGGVARALDSRGIVMPADARRH